MINFRNIRLDDKELYNEYLHQDAPRGWEYSYGNLFMWGTQDIAYLYDHIVLRSTYNRCCSYPFPIGKGDKKQVLDAIFADKENCSCCSCISGINESDKEIIEKLYPGQFYFRADRDNYDYIYDIHALADLKGRKLARKRNHLKHFKNNHPDYVVTPITIENIDEVRDFVADWYKLKYEETSHEDLAYEKIALEKVFTNFQNLDMEGLLLKEHDEVLGFTMASQMYPDTFDVHFEKARGDIDGAYTTINYEFANYIRSKYPEAKYLNREEDMGLPGLRKAKMSYYPHHLVKKYKAFPLRYAYSFDEPADEMQPELRELWKEAFGDSNEFLDSFYTTAFNKSRCRVATIDVDSHDKNKQLAAALYWFDCNIDDQRVAYIYAVATAKTFRSTGACHTLLADTHKHLKSLGYASAVLVPGNDALIHLYEGCEYELCTKRSHMECAAEDMGVKIREIEKEEYARLRREFLPVHAVIQENENLDFLATQAKFYVGQVSSSLDETVCSKPFLLAGQIENENLYGIELLGDNALAPGIVHALGCKDGTFLAPGKEEPFAMFHALTEDAVEPVYFGFAFD